MYALDVLYWLALFLGLSYIGLTLALGGLSHVIGSVHHALDAGGDAASVGDVGQLDASHGDFGHVDSVQADVGHVDAGPADLGHSDFGHVELDHGPMGFGHADGGSADLGDAGGDVPGQVHGGVATGEATHVTPGHDMGGAVDHAHTTDHGHGQHFNLLAFLNPTMASSFLIGFGGGGVLSRVSGAGVLPSMACAGVSGSLLYWYARWLIVRVFGAAQASSHTRRADLVGLCGTVIAPIEGSRPGMITLIIAGSRQTFRAVSSDGMAIPVGSAVRIRHASRDAVIVSRVDAFSSSRQGPPATSQRNTL